MPAPFDRRYCEREMRAAQTDDGARTLSGYAAVFNVETNLWGDYYEIVRAGAFAQAIADGDVRCLWNHNSAHVLGRTSAGTLTLREDAVGLWYECQLPNTQCANDLWESVQRGDVNQSSFGFTIRPSGEAIYREDGEKYIQEIIRVDTLYDVSPVTYPAYESTTVSARTREDLEAFRQQAASVLDGGHEQRTRHLTLLKRSIR